MEYKVYVNNITLLLKQGDITKETTDAIVNAANEQLYHLGGVAAAIAQAAGEQFWIESNTIKHVPTGSSAVTTGGNLPAKYVIHGVGPIWKGGNEKEEELLTSVIQDCLIKADTLQLISIAFPAISTGIYGYPLDLAAKTIINTIKQYTIKLQHIKHIHLVLFSTKDFNEFVSNAKSLLE
ncbi:MAG: macro domain-containing protein [Candidatus Heimdallarchaeota archaeon]|nr:macro domain-containing protein [Candidatus Heimdallarchaeota archaeon]MDH5647052.1 macro domain-containing protein [Candidatus Heimdallarchaeota archaeon]